MSATSGPMVAFQPSRKVCQIFCSLISNLSRAASGELASARMVNSISKSVSFSLSMK